ncbi:MAG: hypothetical protein Q7V62_06405 [Actinomycetota bacterium]|nr:hypothetical protein [Actinomycetota bacterium]
MTSTCDTIEPATESAFLTGAEVLHTRPWVGPLRCTRMCLFCKATGTRLAVDATAAHAWRCPACCEAIAWLAQHACACTECGQEPAVWGKDLCGATPTAYCAECVGAILAHPCDHAQRDTLRYVFK